MNLTFKQLREANLRRLPVLGVNQMYQTHGIFDRSTGQEASVFRFKDRAEAEIRADEETQIVLRIDIVIDRQGNRYEDVEYPEWLWELMEANEANEDLEDEIPNWLDSAA